MGGTQRPKITNIFLDHTGAAFLGDFGAASPTGTPICEWTPGYAPAGHDLASPLCDAYQLAVTCLVLGGLPGPGRRFRRKGPTPWGGGGGVGSISPKNSQIFQPLSWNPPGSIKRRPGRSRRPRLPPQRSGGCWRRTPRRSGSGPCCGPSKRQKESPQFPPTALYTSPAPDLSPYAGLCTRAATLRPPGLTAQRGLGWALGGGLGNLRTQKPMGL